MWTRFYSTTSVFFFHLKSNTPNHVASTRLTPTPDRKVFVQYICVRKCVLTAVTSVHVHARQNNAGFQLATKVNGYSIPEETEKIAT